MEKMDLQTFRGIKQAIIDLLSESHGKYERGESLSQEEEMKIEEKYKELVLELMDYDLSDIGFEEWEGITLISSDKFVLDFSKTRANLDFSIMTNMTTPEFTSFKGCRIRNFDFENDDYIPQMFDYEFIRNNSEQFLKEKVIKYLKYNNYITDLKDIKALSEIYGIDNIGGFLGNNSKKVIEFIKKYGIDNIIRLDEETNGIFSHQIWTNDTYIIMFAEADSITPESTSPEEWNYEVFRHRMYEILQHGRDKNGLLLSGDFPDYDFIQGKFREDYSDIFLDGSFDPEIMHKFYTGRMNAEDVRKNPEIVQFLIGKDLKRIFQKTIMNGYEPDSETPNWVNMSEIICERLGEEEFLKLCLEYGMCLDYISLRAPEEINSESIRRKIEDTIYEELQKSRRIVEYFEDLPIRFKEEHPELFLPEEVDIDFKNKFYKGKLTFADIQSHPEYREIISNKDIRIGMRNNRNEEKIWRLFIENLNKEEVLQLISQYGDFLLDLIPASNGIDTGTIRQALFLDKLKNGGYTNFEELEEAIKNEIKQNIFQRVSPYDENIPRFFKEKYPELFLSEDAPSELKELFYHGRESRRFFLGISVSISSQEMSFKELIDHPEWNEFLKGKDLRLAFPQGYSELFSRFDSETLMKLGRRNPDTIDQIVLYHRENTLERWYKATGGRFVPHHVVMLNFPEEEIDSFLSNSKKWSRLMQIENYSLNDDGKAAILKAAYSMGVFQGNDDGFQRTMELFSGVLKELTEEEHQKIIQTIGSDEDNLNAFNQAYRLDENGRYTLSINAQSNKRLTKQIRNLLEQAEISRILTPAKAHQIFDSFDMKFDPDFVVFFNDNIEQILSNPECYSEISIIQRQFKDIVRTNAGRKLTLELAQDYIKNIAYVNIGVGNERVAEQAKIAGYSQEDFEAIQALFNEGETRDFSSIPRVQGEVDGYTYEMLRCDDPLALTVGTLTDCCQAIRGAGETSMEHSVVSPDGRVFVVRDSEGRLVAQSWFWRNQYTGCFDNIEIPNRIFSLYERENPEEGRIGLTRQILEVYKKAAKELMQEDERVYQGLLENGRITQEQYDGLLLGKVTIGLGYNDIADAIREDKSLRKEEGGVQVKTTDRLPYVYTDAEIQYVVAERERITNTTHENLYVHEDDIPIYNGTNMTSTVLYTLRRMEQETGREQLAYINYDTEEEWGDYNTPKAQRIINSIANEYRLNPSTTEVLSTARIALIYDKKGETIEIADYLTAPIKTDLTEEQRQKANQHLKYQLKKALKQIRATSSQIDVTKLDEDRQQIILNTIREIENDEKEGER